MPRSNSTIDRQVESIVEGFQILGEQIRTVVEALEAETEERLEARSDTAVLLEAGISNTPVSFDYAKVGEDPERRIVSIWTIEGEGSEAIRICGYDHMRDGIRRFRVDRITSTISLEPQHGFVDPDEYV